MALIFKLSSVSTQTPLIIEMVIKNCRLQRAFSTDSVGFYTNTDLSNSTFVKTSGANKWHILYLVSLKYLLCPLSLWTHIFTAGLSVVSLTAIPIQYKYQLLLTL